MTTEAQLSVDRPELGGARLARWVGDIDLATVEEVFAWCSDLLDGEDVDVDLSGVTFMDSTGLRCLLHTNEHVRSRGGRLRVVALSATVERIIELTGVASAFQLELDEDSAPSDHLGSR